jgi:hypothetical protein
MGEQNEGAATEQENPTTVPEEGQTAPDPATEEVSLRSESEAEVQDGDTVNLDAVAAAAPDPVLGALKTAGIEHTFTSGEEFVKSYDNLRKQVGGFDQERAIGREVGADLAAFREWKAEQVKAQEAEERKKAWDVPPLPGNFEAQMALPAEQRDPAFVVAASARARYLNDKWAGYTEDPGLFVQDHVEPVVDAKIEAKFREMERTQYLTKELTPHKDFVAKNYDAIQELVGAMPLEYAVELLRLREQTKASDGKQASEAAKAKDEESFAVTKTGPVGLADVGPQKDELKDFRAIAQAEAERLG